MEQSIICIRDFINIKRNFEYKKGDIVLAVEAKQKFGFNYKNQYLPKYYFKLISEIRRKQINKILNNDKDDKDEFFLQKISLV